MRTKGVSSAIAAGLLVVGLIIGAVGFYAVIASQTKTITATQTTTQNVTTTRTALTTLLVTESYSVVSTVTTTITSTLVTYGGLFSVQSAILSENTTEFPGSLVLTFVFVNDNVVPITGLTLYAEKASAGTWVTQYSRFYPSLKGVPQNGSVPFCSGQCGNYINGSSYAVGLAAIFADGTTGYASTNATALVGTVQHMPTFTATLLVPTGQGAGTLTISLENTWADPLTSITLSGLEGTVNGTYVNFAPVAGFNFATNGSAVSAANPLQPDSTSNASATYDPTTGGACGASCPLGFQVGQRYTILISVTLSNGSNQSFTYDVFAKS